MNPTAEPTLPLHPQPPQPHRSSFSCDRHPDEQFNGFCPSCLCERLTILDQSSSSSSRKPTTTSSAAAAIKAIFRVPGTTTSSENKAKPSSSSSSSLFPELRRTQSFSASKNEGFSGVFEPQRRSCDVRARNTLWSLFGHDDDDHRKSSLNEVETRNLGSVSSSVSGPVLESKEEDDDDHDAEEDDDDDEIRVFEEPSVVEETVEEIVEEIKAMKDHVALDSQASKKPSVRDLKEIAGSFWSAASVFSKKWQKWRQNQKLKKRNTGRDSAAFPIDKPISRQYLETQSEIADYGFGRRSCDTGPRFSLDAGRMSFDAAPRMSYDAPRMSFDDPRYSFDEPRASWDGHLIGRTFPRLPPMVSVVEDPPVVVHVARADTQIPVEEPNFIVEDETISTVPGGSTQTKEYYSDSSSRRRKSLDRSSSIRKMAAAVVAEIDEMKAVSNAKVSPETIDYFHRPKLLVGDRELRDLSSNSLRDDCSETFELGFGDNASVVGNGELKGGKKSRRWSKPWKIWGFIHRHRGGGDKDEDEEERCSRRNGVARSFSESWNEPPRRECNDEAKGGFNRKAFRSNSSVSWRNSGRSSFGFGSARKGLETNGNGRNKMDEFVLERNRSARYSPNKIDNGLLRFYLAPMSSSRRNGAVKSSRPNHTHSIARSVY